MTKTKTARIYLNFYCLSSSSRSLPEFESEMSATTESLRSELERLFLDGPLIEELFPHLAQFGADLSF